MSGRRFSEELEAALSPYREEYRVVVNSWLRSGAFALTYPALLVETYHYVKHSCSLMSTACARLGREHAGLEQYLARHIAEEVGHEQWLLDDLERLGCDRAEVESSMPLAETMQLVGGQLYVINYLHPAGLLGYVYMMESQPPSPESLAHLEALGVPAGALKFLSRHGEEDQTHRVELRDTLDAHFSAPPLRRAATASAVLGLSSVNRLFARIRSGDYVNPAPALAAVG